MSVETIDHLNKVLGTPVVLGSYEFREYISPYHESVLDACRRV